LAKVIIGRLGHSYGVKGWLKVHSFTDPPERILQYQPWQVQHQQEWHFIKVVDFSCRHKTILAKLDGCDTPEMAKTYANDTIAVERDQLPALPQGEYYWADLIGLRVINQEGIDFGVVDSLFATGSNDVLVIKGDRQRLLPYTNQVIQQVDLANGTLLVAWDADF
jgi:16S rRNA processing protein RimM